MLSINVSQAKARLTELIQRAEAGEQIVISRRNHAIVELRVIEPSPARPRPQFGLCRGDFHLPDDFDNPLPEDLLKSFEGE